MKAGAVGQPHIAVGRGVIETPTARCRHPLREASYGRLIREADFAESQTSRVLDPDLIRTIDQDIGDPWLPQQRLKRSRTEDVASQFLVYGEDRCVANGATRGP